MAKANYACMVFVMTNMSGRDVGYRSIGSYERLSENVAVLKNDVQNMIMPLYIED